MDATEWVERLRRTLDSCLDLPDDVAILAIGREPSFTGTAAESRAAEESELLKTRTE